MKQNSTQILELLNKQELKDNFGNLISQYPDHTYNDRTINEAYQQFLEIIDILRVNIENGFFEKISFNKRNQILSYLQSIESQISNVNQTILNVDTLFDYLISLGLQLNLIGKRDFTKEYKNLAELKEELNKIISELEGRKSNIEEFDKNFQNVSDNSTEVNKLLENAKNHLLEIEELKVKSSDGLTAVDTSKVNVNEIEKEVETKKLNISTFSENVDEYKRRIDDLEKTAKEIISKESAINNLISQAEKALNLKSAEGISAAFSMQYGKERNLKWWIIGSVCFIILAIALTIWIIGGWHIKEPNSISSIVGRIVAVGISITGATFCAKQYTKQSNIAEDYAYKAVLSKSIIAFTEEIKKRDDSKVASYLEKVLSEIHQDPLRKRDVKEDEHDSSGIIKDITEKFLDKIPSIK